MSYLTTIELHKEDMQFSAGHYTIFSPTRRERLHGHNFFVHAAFITETDENGIAFDYGIYKQQLRQLCKSLSGRFLLPQYSPYQTIEQNEQYTIAHFNGEKIPFLSQDILLLPLTNVTVEELSTWFVKTLVADQAAIEQYKIHGITLKVYSGPGQCGVTEWVRDES